MKTQLPDVRAFPAASEGVTRRYRRRWSAWDVASCALALLLAPRLDAGLVLDDPLQGSTLGTRSGGAFVAGGWRVTGKDDFILWHIPTVEKGAAEWQVSGLRPGECRAGLEDHGELFHMYDHTYASSDTSYNPGYRDNPFKHFVRKQGCIDIAPDRAKLLWKIGEEVEEMGTNPLSWDATRTYRFRIEWGPDGRGRSLVRLYRDGAVIGSASAPGNYAPPGHSVRIAASTRRDAAAGAPIDAVFSNVKVWDLSAPDPAAPVITDVARDPDAAAPGAEYVRQLSLEHGHPPPAWEVVQGPAGLRVDASGRLSGWTPTAGQVGQRFTVEVRAANALGSDLESWTVEVVEVAGTSFPFTATAEGWALATWKSGPYDPGTIAWEPGGGNPGGNILVTGSGASNNLDSCTREGGTLTRAVSTSGLRAVHVEYDVIAALAGPPGASGAGGCEVLEGSAEDKLVVSYSTRGTGGPWTTAQVILEADLPGAWRRQAIELGGVAAAEDNAAFALRFQWQLNASGDGARLDNIRVEGAAIPREERFRRSDANADGRQDISDALLVLGVLFLGGAELDCEKSGDTNDSGGLDLSDAVHLLNFLFLGGPAPAAPFASCGTDPTPDGLACAEFRACG